MPRLTLQLVAGDFTVSRLAPTEPVPAWAGSPVFSSVTRTADELSIICPTADVPAGPRGESGWSLLKIAGPFDFGVVGVLAAVTEPLARAGISLLAVGTFDTDYVLIKSDRLAAAVPELKAAGHFIEIP